MSYRTILSSLVAGVVVTTAACDTLLEPRDHVYDGPPVIEFAPVLPSGAYSVAVDFAAGADETREVTVGVQYVGPPPESDVTGQFALGSGTTAVEGTHFTAPDGFTIAAGSNRTDVAVELDAGAFEDGESVEVVLELTTDGGVEVSENYRQFTITASKAGS